MSEETGRKKALIVEDDDDIRDMLLGLARHAGLEVESADGGHEALEMIRKGEFGLIVLDYVLPDISGFELYKRVREGGFSMPVIFHTAFVRLLSEKICGIADRNMYVFPKTSQPTDLILMMGALLSGKSPTEIQ